MMMRHIVAAGGGGFSDDDPPTLDDFILDLAVGRRICFIPTASGDSELYIQKFYAAFPPGRCHPTHLALFRRTVRDLRGFILGQDVIYVGGGNTASLLAVWRAHQLDHILREAWERGVVLAGVSAGAMCWFQSGLTDSFGPTLQPLLDGLGFIPGSFCPHYGDDLRRTAFRDSVAADELPAGYGVEGGAALHYVAQTLTETVTARVGARAFHVSKEGQGASESLTHSRALR